MSIYTRVVEQVASGGPVPGSWAAASPAVTEFGSAYCQGLVAFKPKLLALLNSSDPPPKSSGDGAPHEATKASAKSATNGAAPKAAKAPAKSAVKRAPAKAVK
jgi:hypothetical protein